MSLFECRIEVYRDSNALLLKSNDLTVSRIARIFKVSYLCSTCMAACELFVVKTMLNDDGVVNMYMPN